MQASTLALDLVIVAGSIGALWIGAKLLVENAARVARRAGLSELVVGLTVVGFGTSTPELATSVRAALVGAGDLAVGNVVGSNFFNVGVVLGLVSLWAAVPASRALVRRDGVFMVGVTALAAVVVRDGFVGRPEGAVFVALLAGYVAWLLRRGGSGNPGGAFAPTSASTSASSTSTPASTSSTSNSASTSSSVSTSSASTSSTSTSLSASVLTPASFPTARTGDSEEPSTLRSGAMAVVGLAIILVGADLLVASASDLARLAGVSEWAIGETVVAIGTSTPEIAASVVAARRGMSDLAAGNLVGSNVFNVLGILGVAALVRPIVVSPVAFDALVWLVALSAFVIGLLATRGRLTRLEGLVAIVVTVARWIVDAL